MALAHQSLDTDDAGGRSQGGSTDSEAHQSRGNNGCRQTLNLRCSTTRAMQTTVVLRLAIHFQENRTWNVKEGK